MSSFHLIQASMLNTRYLPWEDFSRLGKTAWQLLWRGGFGRSSFFSVIVDNSVLSVFASLGGEWLAQKAQWFLWNIWEFQEDGGLGSPKAETQSPIFNDSARLLHDQIFQFQGYKMTMASIKSILSEAGHWNYAWPLSRTLKIEWACLAQYLFVWIPTL